MGRVHLLPGTTSSNIGARGSDDPKNTATMTISELEAWIAIEIAGRSRVSAAQWFHRVRKTNATPLP
jgi:hypothetical protein